MTPFSNTRLDQRALAAHRTLTGAITTFAEMIVLYTSQAAVKFQAAPRQQLVQEHPHQNPHQNRQRLDLEISTTAEVEPRESEIYEPPSYMDSYFSLAIISNEPSKQDPIRRINCQQLNSAN